VYIGIYVYEYVCVCVYKLEELHTRKESKREREREREKSSRGDAWQIGREGLTNSTEYIRLRARPTNLSISPSLSFVCRGDRFVSCRVRSTYPAKCLLGAARRAALGPAFESIKRHCVAHRKEILLDNSRARRIMDARRLCEREIFEDDIPQFYIIYFLMNESLQQMVCHAITQQTCFVEYFIH